MITASDRASSIWRQIYHRARLLPASEQVSMRHVTCKRSARARVAELLEGKFAVLYMPDVFTSPGLPFHLLAPVGESGNGKFFTASASVEDRGKIQNFIEKIKLPPPMDKKNVRQLADALLRPLKPIEPEPYQEMRGMIQ